MRYWHELTDDEVSELEENQKNAKWLASGKRDAKLVEIIYLKLNSNG